MEFETKNVPGSPDYVEKFLSNLLDRADKEKSTNHKILSKLEDWQKLTLTQLTSAGHIKHLDGDVWEARVRIRKINYRFLGYIEQVIFYMVHEVKKDQRKLAKKEIVLAQKRINLIKIYEN